MFIETFSSKNSQVDLVTLTLSKRHTKNMYFFKEMGIIVLGILLRQISSNIKRTDVFSVEFMFEHYSFAKI